MVGFGETNWKTTTSKVVFLDIDDLRTLRYIGHVNEKYVLCVNVSSKKRTKYCGAKCYHIKLELARFDHWSEQNPKHPYGEGFLTENLLHLERAGIRLGLIQGSLREALEGT